MGIMIIQNNLKNCTLKLNKVYSLLADDISRKIFLERINLYIAKKELHNTSMITIDGMLPYAQQNIQKAYNELQKAIKPIVNIKADTIIFYGAGSDGKAIMYYSKPFLYGKKLLFCDKVSDKLGAVLKVPVISPDELVRDYYNNQVVITSSGNFNSIYDLLTENGWSKDKIIIYDYKKHINPNQLICDPYQYFPDDIISLTEDEIFVDCGCYDGANSLEFVERCKGKYKKIYAFEPDKVNADTIRRSLSHLENIVVEEIGVWNKQDTLKFSSEGNMVGKISADSGLAIQVDTIDNVCKNEKVSFIKMDIEGAEQNALLGAKETILQNNPKLAICVYHSFDDLIEIPLLINSFSSEYKLYLRHHSVWSCETVLYATL